MDADINQQIAELEAKLSDRKRQYELLYKRTKKYIKDKKTAETLCSFYSHYRFSRDVCKDCNSNIDKFNNLKSNILDTIERIERKITLNAELSKEREEMNLEAQISELKCDNIQKECFCLLALDETDAVFEEKMDLKRQFNEEVPAAEVAQKELKKQRLIEAHERDELSKKVKNAKSELRRKQIEINSDLSP